jgi:hypothetical protein
MLKRVLHKDLIPVISRSVMKKPPFLRYFGLLPVRLVSEKSIATDWSIEVVILMIFILI